MQEKKQMLITLMNSKEFKEIILKDFLDDSLKEVIYNNNIDNDNTRSEVKARQILRRYFENILDYDSISN